MTPTLNTPRPDASRPDGSGRGQIVHGRGLGRNTGTQVLGCLEADLDACVRPVLDVLGAEASIAPGEVFDRATLAGKAWQNRLPCSINCARVGARGSRS